MAKFLLSMYVSLCLYSYAIFIQANDSTETACTLDSFSACMCRHHGGNIYIQCHNAVLGKIPNDIPSTTATLYIDQDDITSLDNQTFYGLENMTVLEIRQVKLATIEVGAFNGLSSLQELDLTNNELTTLHTGVFGGLTELVSLELDSNHIEQLPPGIFSDLKKLQELHLSRNKLSVIDSGALLGLSSLTTLMINNNGMESVPTRAMTSLQSHSLRTLGLHGNAFSRLRGYDLNIDPLRNLSTLLLNDNMISTVSENAFVGLSVIATLDLSGNNLHNLTTGAFSNVFRSPNDGPAKLLLTDNPLVCDCEMSNFIEWGNTTRVNVEGTCRTPTYLRETPVQEVTSSQLRCRAVLVVPSNNSVVEYGQNMTVCCNTFENDVRVTWFAPSTGTNYADDTCIFVEMKTDDDFGVYTCVATVTGLYDEAHILLSLPPKTTIAAPVLETTKSNDSSFSKTPNPDVIVTYTLATNDTLMTTKEANFIEKHSTETIVAVSISVVIVVVIVSLVIYCGCRNRRKEKKNAKGDVRSTSVSYSPMHGDAVQIQSKSKTTNPKYAKLATNNV